MDYKWLKIKNKDGNDIYIDINHIVAIEDNPNEETDECLRYVYVDDHNYYEAINSVVEIIEGIEHPMTLKGAYIEGTSMGNKGE